MGCHAFGQNGWAYIRSYEVDERRKNQMMNKVNYE